MKNIRILLIGFIVGGAAGAKVGAYLSSAMNEAVSWSPIEQGAGIGIALGCIVSAIVILAKAGIFSARERQLGSTHTKIATGRA